MKKLFLLFTFAFFIFNSFAEEDVIIVSAGKIEQTLEEAVDYVQVLSEEKIKESGAKNLTEAMKNLPGVTIKTASPGNPTDSISMQGFSSSYVKILVNGIEVSGDISGSPVINSIPLEDVEHIEVIQGASSSLYGSDAMGGVINIITKKSESSEDGIKFSGSLTEEASLSVIGDFRNYTGVQTKLSGENLSLGLTGSFDYSPGTKKTANDVLAGKVDYYETSKKSLIYGKTTIDWNDDWGNLGIFALYNTANQSSNYSPVGFDTSSTMEYDTKRIEGGITVKADLTDSISLSGFSCGKYFTLFTEQEVKADSSSNQKDENTNSKEWENEVRASFKLFENNQLLTGIHANLETIDGDSFSDEEKQWYLSAYAQDTISFLDDKLNLVFGGRFDFAPSVKNCETMYMITPKFSTKFEVSDNTIFRFSYGMGYKVPTLKQKYWVFRHSYAAGEGNFILTGNPNLKSEKSQSFNLRIEENLFNLVKIDSGIFFNYVDDMISSVVTDSESNPQKRTYVNINKAITYGGDIVASTKLDRFDFNCSYAYTGTKKKDGDEWNDLTLRVHHRIGLGAGYLIPEIETKVRLDGEWNSPQLLSSDSSGDVYTPDYLMVSAFIGKTFFDEKLELYFRGNNLLNNFSLKNGTDSNHTNQKTYYGLNAGTTFTLGGKIKL